MADNTLAKIIGLIESSDSWELRQAALRVVGQVATGKEKNLVRALLGSLDSEEPEVRRAAIEALGNLKVEESLPRLEQLARQGGAELESAVWAAGQMGAKGARVMTRVMNEAPAALRSRMAGILAKSGTGNALVVTAHALLDSDPKVVEAAARSLAGEVPSFSTVQKNSLAKFLIESLHDREGLAIAAETGMLRVLGTLHDARAQEVFWSRVDPKLPKEIRAAALHGLGTGLRDVTDARFQKLLACAADGDFQVVAPALMILQDIPANRKNQKHWLKLLDAPDVATRRFLVNKLKGLGTREWAEALVGQISHPDRALRDEVLAELGNFDLGREGLLDHLLESKNSEEAWFLARSLAPRFQNLSLPQKSRVFDLACAFQEKEDRRAAPFWFFLREVDHHWVRDQLEARALNFRKKKKFPQALEYLRLLVQEAGVGEEIRFELACCQLHLGSKDLALESRQNDPALHQFARLLQNSAFDLLDRLKKARWLENEDLFYLGFHLVEQQHRARDLGRQILEVVIERTPKTELGKNARRKLKSEAANS